MAMKIIVTKQSLLAQLWAIGRHQTHPMWIGQHSLDQLAFVKRILLAQLWHKHLRLAAGL